VVITTLDTLGSKNTLVILCLHWSAGNCLLSMLTASSDRHCKPCNAPLVVNMHALAYGAQLPPAQNTAQPMCNAQDVQLLLQSFAGRSQDRVNVHRDCLGSCWVHVHMYICDVAQVLLALVLVTSWRHLGSLCITVGFARRAICD
jgi:hypothetical protein